jgi:hypothetical protein
LEFETEIKFSILAETQWWNVFPRRCVSPLLKGQKRSKRQAEKVAKCQLKGETH